MPAAALPQLQRHERVLATAQEDVTGHWLVLTTWRLLERTPDGMTVLELPWHGIDSGAWDPDTWTLTVSFVDGGQARQWVLQRRTGPGRIPEIFHERTSASVVLIRAVDLGRGRTARVTIRKDLHNRELLEQVLMGRGSRAADGPLMEQVLIARQEVRGQVGMDPVGADD
ncbi:MAG: hypothetical protein Q4P07_13380 [Ornithinimicrobium sp.]|uniref:hypothetical protein n=1 Tax=Ornithinimicrobium sp. TaxID=1977084 RepID=UPI0026E04A81|nr:hypothetical protein [Ornithinimicrobium sp.]MDO5741128.1 hypothetical protein [Ornithinimicrobium sp.]